MPLISVILDNYNYADYLPEAIDSVLSQTYSDFELIIVDDGSTDNSHEIIKRYDDHRIITVFKENGGQTCAFNAGFATSKGDIVAFLDSDDYWYPHKLEKIVQIHESAKIVQHYLAENGENIYRKVKRDVDWSTALTKYGYMYQHSPTSALSFRRETIEPFFPLIDPEDMRGHADGCLLMLALTKSGIFCMNDVLGFYRVHGKNLHANSTDKGTALLDVSVRQRMYANKQLTYRGLSELPYDNGEYIESQLSSHDFESEPVAIYGTGNSGNRVANVLDKKGITVWGFANSQGSDGAVSPKELYNARNEFGKVVIASSEQEAIHETLLASGFDEACIVALGI